MKKYHTAITGGGASGILSAIILKENGIDCSVFESQDRILKKLLVTGNGRCNLTNAHMKDSHHMDKYFSTSGGKESLQCLKKYGFEKIREKLMDLGIPMVELEEGKMYPYSLQASAVVDLLRERLQELSVPVFTSTPVTSLYKKGSEWVLKSGRDEYTADNVIISVGGSAMPSTGSDGSFMAVLKNLGLSSVPFEPALVQLKVSFPQLKALSGVKTESRIYLKKAGKILCEEKGELLFTDYGISGPPVLQISRFCAENSYRDLTVVLDLFPDLTRAELKRFIENQAHKFPERPISNLIPGILSKKLIPVIFKASGVEKMTDPAKSLTLKQTETITGYLKEWELPVTGHNGFKNAQSTVGGIKMSEVNPETMECRRHPSLYLTGEVLDVCGACGGYNLTWAFSSAMAASEDIILRKK